MRYLLMLITSWPALNIVELIDIDKLVIGFYFTLLSIFVITQVTLMRIDFLQQHIALRRWTNFVRRYVIWSHQSIMLELIWSSLLILSCIYCNGRCPLTLLFFHEVHLTWGIHMPQRCHGQAISGIIYFLKLLVLLPKLRWLTPCVRVVIYAVLEICVGHHSLLISKVLLQVLLVFHLCGHPTLRLSVSLKTLSGTPVVSFVH